MRHWNLLCLVALLAAALIAVSGVGVANAAGTSTSSNFKGKAAVYDRADPAYFVVNFTYSSGQLTGNWTWVDRSGTSYSGTLAFTPCAVSVPRPWSSTMSPITLSPQKGGTAMLNLMLSNITMTKTYVSDTTTCSGTTNPCIVIQTFDLGTVVGFKDSGFDSTTTAPGNPPPYGTLTLSVR